MKVRKVLAMVLGLAMLLSLAACGGDSGSKDEAAHGDCTEITFWHSMDRNYGEILDQQIQKFNDTIGKEKNIKVSSVFQSYPGTDALSAAMSSDDYANIPDVIQLYSESISLVRDYDRVVWAEDLFDANSSVVKADFVPNIARSFEIENKMIGIPYNIAGYLLYYNQDQLAAAGYSKPPATLQEMAEMIPSLVEKTDADFGLNVRINMNELIAFIEGQGGSGSYFGNNENGHAGFMTELACADDGTLKTFIDTWGDIIETGGYKAVRDSINEEFAVGSHSMVIMSSSRLRTIEEQVSGAFEWGVAPVPAVKDGDCVGSFPTGSGLFIMNREDDAKVKAAWEFVQYMASPEIQAQWVESTGYVPVNSKALETDTYKNCVAENPWLSVAYEAISQAPESMTSPFVPNYSEVDTLIKDTMIAYAGKSLDADGAYTAIVDGTKRIFEDYYRANPIG